MAICFLVRYRTTQMAHKKKKALGCFTFSDVFEILWEKILSQNRKLILWLLGLRALAVLEACV